MFEDLIYKRLTDEQKSFVDDNTHSVLVSASAGTGKTTTMIRKIVNLILNQKISVDKLLVVTFTTAAATKMKHDLYNILNLAIESTTSEEQVLYINEQIDLLNIADFGTIDAFCNKLVKQYFYALDIDPNYEILSSEKERKYLFDKAISTVFEKYGSSDNLDFSKIYQIFNTGRSEENFRSALHKLYNYLICKVDGDGWFEEKIKEMYLPDSPCVKFLLDYYKSQFKSLSNRLIELLNKAVALNHDKLKAFAITRLDLIRVVLESSEISEITNSLENCHLASAPTIKEVELSDIDDAVAELKGTFNKVKEKALDHLTISGSSDLNCLFETNKNNVLIFYKILKDVESEFKALKKKRNVLDFNDLEHYALNILQDSVLRESIKNNYDYIFIDEYQDVNQMQEEIITSLQKTNNLYMIGDLKQSIYRFRQSTPEIFLSKYNLYKNYNNDNKLILFNKNFRSHDNILKFANKYFSKCITKDCVGIDYNNEAQLVSGRDDITNGKVVLSLIDRGLIDKGVVSQYDLEAEVIVKNIARVVENGRYKFKDIGVLFRKKKELAKAVWLTLKKYNIPVNLTLKENIFNKNEIQVLYALLKCIYNESNDLAFAILLKSPIVGATDDELAEIRIKGGDGTFYESCISIEQLSLGVSKKINFLRSVLKKLRFQVQYNKIVDVVKNFIIDNGLMLHYLSMPDGLEKECYIMEFLKLLDNASYDNNMAKMLDYLEVCEERESEITISDGEDSVSLITMHLSKGLDYPVVIVGGFCENLQSVDRDILRINKEYGVAISGVDEDNYAKLDNINSVAISIKNRMEEFEESIRLLYVALTRAKEELIITGALADIKKKELFDCKTPFDLFLLTLGGPEIMQFVNKKSSFEIKYDNGCVINCEIAQIYENQDINHSEIVLNLSNPEIVCLLKEYHNKKETSFKNIAFKNSVSSILKDENVDYVNALSEFRGLTTSESLLQEDAMELGTQYHIVMQYIDYGHDQDIQELITKLALSGKINSIYLNKIDVSKIEQAKQAVESIMDCGAKIVREAKFVTMYPHNLLVEGSVCDKKVIVQGVIDLVIENDGDCIIVDFKTNRTHNKKALVDKYRTQLKLYSKAYELCYNKEVKRRLLYSFEMGEFIEV